MPTAILATKLYLPPPRPKRVLRHRLIERLDEGIHRKLTLVSAPAGFGKTTLTSEWVDGCGRPAAWLSLDQGDNDLNQFLTYLVAALRSVAPELGGEVLEMLQSPPPLPTEPILTALLNDISAVAEPFVLVLDDYHVIDAGPVDRALTFLLERLPPQLHLVVVTREDPALPLARLRVRGQVTELRAADLRFTPTEAAAFLNQAMGLDLSADDIATLETRTEGWIAGLQLAALALEGAITRQGREDVGAFIASFTGSHRFVLDYLVEEVLQQQSESVQAFLLRTSILDRLCGPLCDALLSDAAAPGQETLEYLERANLLVVPLDGERRWYRYHQLFAEVLRSRLMKEQPHQVAGLHRVACEWYDRSGLSSDAVRHALAAEDFERAADLIELAWSDIRRSCFRSPTWLGWVRALPDELVRMRPVLSVGYAWELISFGELAAAERSVLDAERWLEPALEAGAPPQHPAAAMVVVNEAEFASLRGLLAAIRGYCSQAHGDMPGTVQHARRALALASESDHYTRGVAGSLLGLAYWTRGELEIAHQSIAEATANLQLAGNTLFAISIAFVLADLRIAQGRLHEAVNSYRRALQLATVQGESVLQGTADLYLGLSELHHERGDREGARQHLRTSEELGEQVALPHWPQRLLLAKARFEQARGDLDGALALLDEAEGLPDSGPGPDVRPLTARKARLWLAQGKLNQTLAWARERGLSVDDELSYLREFEHLTLARLLLAQYRSGRAERSLHDAETLLKRLLKAAEAGDRTGSAIEILLLQALAQEARGDISAALEPLARALTLAEPEGYVQLFADEGAPLARLLTEAAVRGIAPDYVATLLAAFDPDGQRKGQADRPPTSATDSLIEPLSQRELEVLQLIAQGLSNQEIGTRLFRALSTVKGHNRNIFGKLQVRNRTEAVARARELGLL